MGSSFGDPNQPAAGSDPTSSVVRNKLNWLREVLVNLLVVSADDSAGVQLRDNVGRQPGNIILNAHAGTEPGCLPCDGASYSRASYPALFAKIGLTWGTPADPSLFYVPLFNGVTFVCSGSSGGLTPRSVGQRGGFEDAVVVTHGHGVNDPGHNHGNNYLRVSGTAIGVTGPGNVTAVNSDQAFTGVSIQQAGQSGTGRNMPPFAVVRAWIKY